jgi:excinuclease ABC subunit B
MYEGDKSRKSSLVNYGFRLTSALDNRPLKFEEWDRRRNQTVYVSATPAEFELNKTQGEIVEQIIRPTGLLDPICEIRSAEFQVDDLVNECRKLKEQNLRVLALTLTKKMAEQLNTYLNDIGVKSCYLHSDIDTIERIEVINKLRSGEIDVIVGINLLREGIDIPECGLVAILDADKEGFLRNNSSLIQMIGRAARNSNGRVILYADKHTKSINYAIEETNRRRKIQEDYNVEHGITPTTIIKKIRTIFDVAFGDKQEEADKIITSIHDMDDRQLAIRLKVLKKKMKEHAANLEFEEAMTCRNEIKAIEKVMI